MLLPGDRKAPLMKTSASYETLLTVSLPEELYNSLVAYQARHGLLSVSHVIRHAIQQFDFSRVETAETSPRQISFRIPADLRSNLTKQAKAKQASLGHLIRAALRVLPDQPNPIPNKDKSMPPKTAKKAPVKKAAVKKAPAKKVAVKKAPVKKVAAKAPAKKAAVKKAPVKKVAVKKAPAKKVAAKKAPAKKVAAKK